MEFVTSALSRFLLTITLAVVIIDVCSAGVAVEAQLDDTSSNSEQSAKPRRILVFGGNGMLGSRTVDRLIREGDNVTIVNRGNWYWDSKHRIVPYVRTVSCDRDNSVTSCELLTRIIQNMRNHNERFNAVIDFSARGPQDINDTISLLSGSVELYIYISSDSVYDVSEPSVHEGHEGTGFGRREVDAVRPSDPNTRDILANHYQYGNRKLECEEELIKQRHAETGQHIPYVILRLPDVIGSRDTTYRFWIYQMWIKLSLILTDHPVLLPNYLVDYNNSFVFADDVATLIVDRLLDGAYSKDVIDQIFNVAWPQNITLQKLLLDMAQELKLDGEFKLKITNESGSLYLYPTGRRGPIDSSKVQRVLGWQPTDWKLAIRETVEFYERVIKEEEFETQRNEIIQVVRANIYHENRTKLYEAVEKLYDIDLGHFKPKEEL